MKKECARDVLARDFVDRQYERGEHKEIASEAFKVGWGMAAHRLYVETMYAIQVGLLCEMKHRLDKAYEAVFGEDHGPK